MFLGLPDPEPDPLVKGMDPAPDPAPSLILIKVLNVLKDSLLNKILTQNFSKKLNFKTEDNVSAGKL
jgi:hypothetical protein